MSFSGDVFTKKLSGLQETQDSIVSISQWVLFHHRHAKESSRIWQQVILAENSANKKLSLLYLCNDVVQQAKRKRKLEFIQEFSLVLPETLTKIYSSLNSQIKGKVDRLIGVWEERLIFSSSQINDFRSAIQKSERNSKIPSGPAVVPQLSKLNELFLKYNTLVTSTNGNYTQFNIQSNKYLGDSQSNLPLPKIYISKLNVLEKLANISKTNLNELIEIKDQINLELAKLLDLADFSQDSSKLVNINTSLAKLNDTRNELKSMVNQNSQPGIEESSPDFDPISSNDSELKKDDSDDDLVPTYEDSDDDGGDDDEKDNGAKSNHKSSAEESTEEIQSGQPTLKRRASTTPSGGSTPKKVAFSEDIEVKEFEREENSMEQEEVKTNDDVEVREFASHHKDQIELKHDLEGKLKDSVEYNVDNDVSGDDDGYDPQEVDDNKQDEGEASDVMSLLMKLS